MKKLLLGLVLLSFHGRSEAQSTVPAMDRSPMDMSYYPRDYPLLKIQDKLTEPLLARIIYSRPNKDGRVIFGDLIAYGKVWRLGANEATEIEFFQPVKINGNKIKKGRYTMYAILGAEKWTLILNKETDTWGSFRYDEQKDLLRVDVPVEKQADRAESFVMFFTGSGNNFSLQVLWDDIKVELPITR